MKNFHRSAIIITIEGLGSRWLGAYGNAGVRTPTLDRLAGQSTVVENAHFLAADDTNQFCRWFSDRSARQMIELMKSTGWSVVAMTDSHRFASEGEDFFSEVVEVQVPTIDQPTREAAETWIISFMAGCAELWQTLPAERTLLWIHATGLAGDWDAPLELRKSYQGDDDPDPPETTARLDLQLADDDEQSPDIIAGWQQVVAAQVQIVDTAIGLLLGSIVHDDMDSAPMVCVAGITPVGLGEHFCIGRAESCLFYDEFLRVPFILQLPDKQEPARLQNFLSVDRLPGIIGELCLGESFPEEIDGTRWPVPERELLWSRWNEDGMIRTPSWKLVVHGDHRELFLKPDDRWDQNDVAILCSEVMKELEILFARTGGLAADSEILQENELLASRLVERVR